MSSTKKVGYYLSKSGKDVIDWCEDFGLMDNAYVFTIMKYLARAGKKPGNSAIQDLKKALDYLNRYIKFVEAHGKNDEAINSEFSDIDDSNHKLKLKKGEKDPEEISRELFPSYVPAVPAVPAVPCPKCPGFRDPYPFDTTPILTCGDSSNTVSTGKAGFVEYSATNEG